MKLYLVCKKQYNKIILRSYFITLGLIFFGIFFILPPFLSYAQTVVEIRNKMSQKDADIARLEAEINVYQNELDNIGRQKNSLSNSIKELDLTKKKLNADISVTQKKIDKTNLQIQNLNSDIGDKESAIGNNINSIKLEIKKIDELENINLVETILSNNDFTAIWNDLDNIITVRESVRDNTKKLKETKVVLEDTREETIQAKNELTRLKTQLSDQQKIVVQNTNEKNKLLKQTKNNEANYQRLLRDRIAQRDAFEQELRDYESQLQFILDPTKLPSAGVLSWPLKNIYITQLFGKTVDAKRLYVSGTHNGVDFRASVGTPVMAMADGAVLGVGDTDLTCVGASYGKFIFIKYNNGLSSTFGHLSLIKVYKGQIVKKGQIVGYSGNTGHTTGPHLHVSLYASEAVQMASKPSAACNGRIYTLPVSPINAYLDALFYLPPATPNMFKK